ncbi:phospholipase D family protein [Burkholderia vietnamiensis]|uniref:phospholipase D family protein n=1 Tax=Burkholderia vietnamiensis TaxID=60552 RepID=UPI001CF313CA|nr:phospholipase D family protein [Burkholderia vietnamiensis]MCA8450532.1 phospholipase D family protein [Burkholderia vietnamiensis]HDR8952686.1 phospholipase D family protein [Burkholderia vietnamiensis]
MADVKFLLQAVTADTHANAINNLLAFPDANQILVSVAYLRTTGLGKISAALEPVIKKVVFFIGIRNELTSIQAFRALIKLGACVYAVDTGSRTTIFHPKLYMARNGSHACAIIGSANLTTGGLQRNIEASTTVSLDLSNASDAEFVGSTFDSFSHLPKDYPDHVFKVTSLKEAEKLFVAGRLADETIVPAPATLSVIQGGDPDELSPMPLRGQKQQTNQKGRKTKAVTVEPVTFQPPPKIVPRSPRALTPYQVWCSGKLVRRDLNIPEGKKTNRTGSIGLKKGLMDGINPRHYFRDVVFAGLDWVTDKPKTFPHLELAEATFEVIIKNVNYGSFVLKIRHNTDKESTTYKQGNEVTHLRWGDILPLIKREDLFQRTLRIYRKESVPPTFVLEID